MINLMLFVLSYKTDIERFKQKVAESIDKCREETLNPDPSDPHSVKYFTHHLIPIFTFCYTIGLLNGLWM